MASISDGDIEALRSRIEDTVRLCDKRGVPCFLGFLDLRELADAGRLLRPLVSDEHIAFFGGYPDAERTMLSVSPSYYHATEADYPFCAVAFRYRVQKKLSHRDVLGTLMSVGIRRDAVGDILCGDGLSVAFIRREILDYVCEQIDRIGGEGVTVIADYDGTLPISVEYESLYETVASPRLDSVTKALTHTSRDQAAQWIRMGAVSINHQPTDSVSKCVTEGDVLSVRGFGRYYIDQIGPITKKGRLALFARRRL